ncbi:EAL domain-containing protein [Pseudomonas sp. AOB-7]|nr:EAL domain-containing protein [Pseudomonas sp. AOB-7]
MSTLSVLVLEEHPLHRSLAVKMLQSLGVGKVFEACEGREALALLRCKGGVDIAICDLRMHDMVFLREVWHSGLVRAVALSSDIDSGVRNTVAVMVEKLGVSFLGNLGKIFSLDWLREVLSRYDLSAVRGETLPLVTSTEMPPRDEIERALANGEFVAYFQPKVDLQDGRVLGAEVLARWQHPKRGLLGPDSFLPAIEQLGLLDQLFWQLFQQGLELQIQSPGIALAFNVHPSQLNCSRLPDNIWNRLRLYGMPATGITLEVTETGILSASPKVMESLIRLRLMGCILAMDDFGVGYSSLKRLCELPFNQIKLDASFVRGLHRGSRGYAAIGSAVSLAKSLNISLVTEGVETSEQSRHLLDLGCREAQGYLFGRPVSGAALRTAMLSRRLSVR